MSLGNMREHGVCSVECWPDGTAKEPGTPREGWEESAAQTPLGAYYRIETDWIVALQAAVDDGDAGESLEVADDATIESPSESAEE